MLIIILVIIIVIILSCRAILGSNEHSYNGKYVKEFINTNYNTLKTFPRFHYCNNSTEMFRAFRLDENIMYNLKNRYKIVEVSENVMFVNGVSNKRYTENIYRLDHLEKNYYEFNLGKSCEWARCGTICTTSCYTFANENLERQFGVSCSSVFIPLSDISISRIVIMRSNQKLRFLNIGIDSFHHRIDFANYLARLLFGEGNENKIKMTNAVLREDHVLHERIIWHLFESYIGNEMVDGIIHVDTSFNTDLNRYVISNEFQVFAPEKKLHIAGVLYLESEYSVKLFLNFNTWKSFVVHKLERIRRFVQENLNKNIIKIPNTYPCTEQRLQMLLYILNDICKVNFHYRQNDWYFGKANITDIRVNNSQVTYH